MDKDYWLNRWQHNEIVGFNQVNPNIYLQKYLPKLKLLPGSRIFVPLCGKSIDMLWLYQQGYSILGLDISPIACQDFFVEHAMPVETGQYRDFTEFKHEHLELLVGDFFDLTASDLKAVDAVYDRAALIALPQDLRVRYARHMSDILQPGTQVLLITFSSSEKKDGPPFAVNEQEVHTLFSEAFQIEKLHDKPTDLFPNASNQIYCMLKR